MNLVMNHLPAGAASFLTLIGTAVSLKPKVAGVHRSEIMDLPDPVSMHRQKHHQKVRNFDWL